MSALLLEPPMAKKQTTSRPVSDPTRKPPGRPKGLEPRRVQAIALKGREEWKDWLRRFTAFMSKREMSDLVEDSLTAYAVANGFEKPPMR